ARQLPLCGACVYRDLHEAALRLRFGAALGPLRGRPGTHRPPVQDEPPVGLLRGRAVMRYYGGRGGVAGRSGPAMRWTTTEGHVLIAATVFALPLFWLLVTSRKRQFE